MLGSTTSNPGIADNRARLTFSFYVGDRWQFNGPLPRAYFDATATAVNAADGYGTHVQRNVYDWSYGDLRVDT